MQAIQSIESAVTEIPRRSSPFRALIWKEWRQQRWIFLSLAGLAYALLAAALLVDRYGNSFHTEYPSFLAGGAFLFAIVAVVVLSANAFSAEMEDNTDQFLATIPCSRSKLFWAKLGFVLFLVLMGLIPVGAAVLVDAGLQPHVHLYDLATGALAIAAVVLVLAIVPALVASFGGSVIATILASAPVIAACFAYAFYSLKALIIFVPIESRLTAYSFAVFVVLLTVLAFTTLLLAAWRTWIRVERTGRSSLHMAAATAGLLIAYVVVPAATAYFYVTLLAPLSYFLNASGPLASGNIATVSPNGKYVTFDAYYQGWGPYGNRAALVDANSGRTQWLTRFRNSIVVSRPSLWSPSGNQLVLSEADHWLWPFARVTTTHPAHFVANAQSGEKRSLDKLCPSWNLINLEPVGWCSEEECAFRSGDEMFFLNMERHEVRQCEAPAALRVHSFSSMNWPLFTRRGIFVSGNVKGEMRIFRYAPELQEAEIVTPRNVSGSAVEIQASEDGEWLLMNLNQEGKLNWYLVRAVAGAKAEPLTCANPTYLDDTHSIPPKWRVRGFLPGGHQIVLFGKAELGLFDAESHNLRRIPIALVTGEHKYVQLVELSPAGGFALVLVVHQVWDSKGYPSVISKHVVIDLHNGTSLAFAEAGHEAWKNLQWLGEDHLMSQRSSRSIVIMNRDGTGERPLLAK